MKTIYIYKLGVFILCLFLIVGVLSLPKAEANDTRNRVLTQQINWTYNFKYDRKHDPYYENYKVTQNVDINETGNMQLSFRVYKDSLEIISPFIFSDYYPAYNEGLLLPYPLSISAYTGGMLGVGRINVPDTGMTVTYDTIESEGIQFVKRVILSGKAKYLNVFNPYGEPVRVNFTPNTKYYIDVPNIESSERREIGYSYRKVWGYYRSSLGKVIGYANSGSSSGEYNSAYYRFNNISGPNYSAGNWVGVIYTPADDPSIILSNITTSNATISWGTNNTNPNSTSYTLQYQELNINGNPQNEGDWKAWTTIPIDGANTTIKLTTTANIFKPDNTYRLRVQVNHIGGASYNIYSDYVIFSTSADPAVRAAQEAAIAAQAAKKAAEDSVQYSMDAKNQAEIAAMRVYDYEENKSVAELVKEVRRNIYPNISSINGSDNIYTAIDGVYNLKISADDSYLYRAYIEGQEENSVWTSNTTIIINEIPKGIKNIVIQAKNELGNITTRKITIFSI